MIRDKRAYGRKTTKCPFCGKLMELDDIDYNFDGNQNEYYACFDCYTSALVKVRYSRIVKTEYTDEYGNEIRG